MLHESPQFRVILAAGDHETRQPWIVEPPSRLGRQEVAGRSEGGEPAFEEELVVVLLQFGGLRGSRLHAVLPQDEIHGDADGRAQGQVFRESKPEDPQPNTVDARVASVALRHVIRRRSNGIHSLRWAVGGGRFVRSVCLTK